MISITLNFENTADARVVAHALEIRAIELEQALLRNPTAPWFVQEDWRREMNEARAANRQLMDGTREPV